MSPEEIMVKVMTHGAAIWVNCLGYHIPSEMELRADLAVLRTAYEQLMQMSVMVDVGLYRTQDHAKNTTLAWDFAKFKLLQAIVKELRSKAEAQIDHYEFALYWAAQPK